MVQFTTQQHFDAILVNKTAQQIRALGSKDREYKRIHSHLGGARDGDGPVYQHVFELNRNNFTTVPVFVGK